MTRLADERMNPGRGHMTLQGNETWSGQPWGNTTDGSQNPGWGPDNSTGMRPGSGYGPGAGNMTFPQGMNRDNATGSGNWSAFDPAQRNVTGQGHGPVQLPVQDTGNPTTDSIIASFLNLFGVHSR